jgi:hypothetical protein
VRCPVCRSQEIEPVEGARLSARLEGLPLREFIVSAYHCHKWHVFTVFDMEPLENKVRKNRVSARSDL